MPLLLHLINIAEIVFYAFLAFPLIVVLGITIHKLIHSRNRKGFIIHGLLSPVLHSIIFFITCIFLIAIIIPDNYRGDVYLIYDKVEAIYFALALNCLPVLLWCIYIFRVDLFKSNRLKEYLFAFFLSIIISSAAWFFSFNFNPLRLNGFIDALTNNIIEVAFIGELLKCLPFLFILIFTKWIKEPADYILFASVSALGYCLIANTFYFNYSWFNPLLLYIIINPLIQMATTSIVAYGFMISNNDTNKIHPSLIFFCSYIIAAIFHGFFLSLYASWGFGGFLIYFIMIMAWMNMLNNGLNNSPFFDASKKLHVRKVQRYLAYSLTVIFIIGIFTKIWLDGYDNSIENIFALTLCFLLTIPLIALRISRIDLIKGYWKPFNYFLKIDEQKNAYPGEGNVLALVMLLFSYNKLAEYEIIQEQITLEGTQYNPIQGAFDKIEHGYVVKKVVLYEGPEKMEKDQDGEHSYFLIKFYEQAIPFEKFNVDHVLIRFKDPTSDIKFGKDFLVDIVLIKNPEVLQSGQSIYDDVLFAGEGFLNFKDEKEPELFQELEMKLT